MAGTYILIRWVSMAEGAWRWVHGQRGYFRAVLIDPSLGGSESGLLRAKATVEVVAESGQVDMASTGPTVSAYTSVLRIATEEGWKLGVGVRTAGGWDVMAESRERRLNATEDEAAAWLAEHADEYMVQEARHIYGDDLALRVLRADSASKLYGPDWPRRSLERLLRMHEQGLRVAEERRVRRSEELLLPTYTVVTTVPLWAVDEGDAPSVGDRVEATGNAKQDGFAELRVVRTRRCRKNESEYEYTLECKPA